jgi:mRNA interferase MazF
VKRGELYYIMPADKPVGSEQWSGRPGIIVSNNVGNTYADIVTIVYTTTQAKTDLPTHVTIRATPKTSTALCEQVTTVSTQRLGDRIGECSEEELARIDDALAIALDIPMYSDSPEEEEEEEEEEDTEFQEDLVNKYEKEISVLSAKLEVYQSLLDGILTRTVLKGALYDVN